MLEVWKKIPEMPEYEVSNERRIRCGKCLIGQEYSKGKVLLDEGKFKIEDLVSSAFLELPLADVAKMRYLEVNGKRVLIVKEVEREVRKALIQKYRNSG